MKQILLGEDGETVKLITPTGTLYVSRHELGGFLIVSDRGFTIQPRADNSIRLVCELMDKDKLETP